MIIQIVEVGGGLFALTNAGNIFYRTPDTWSVNTGNESGYWIEIELPERLK